jgi:hypothetical protein
MAEWRYSSIILDLGARWRKAAGFTHAVALLPGKELRYPFNRGLEEHQSWSGRCPFRE